MRLVHNLPRSHASGVGMLTVLGAARQVLGLFGDKTSARELAIKQNVPVIPGTDGPCNSLKDARKFIEGNGGIGYPVMVKATMGGGGRGMRVTAWPLPNDARTRP